MLKYLGALSIIVLGSSCGSVIAKRSANNDVSPPPVETGAHWANPSDFADLKRLGYQFAVVAFDGDRKHWAEGFDAAEHAGIRLIAGLHPYAYKLDALTGDWEIDATGRDFIAFARSRKHLLKALYVFNEPYWLDPATGQANPCGAVPASQLRRLRSAIRGIWPEARIYHDLGRPSQWAPGGGYALDHGCVGDRYRDAAGVADYAGIWYYPVARQGYDREAMMAALRTESDYVTKKMEALPIVLGQAFRCSRCSGPTRMPAREEVLDMNCTKRWLAPAAISWYPWRQPAYEESLARHRELWDATSPRACPHF